MVDTNFCRSCGKILQPGMAKCPDCGAPQGSAVAPARVGRRANLVGFMLITSFLLGTFSGLGVLLGPDPVANQPALLGFSFPINGTVRDANNTPLSGANVTMGSFSAVTSENGTYAFESVPLGAVEIEFRAPGHGNLTVRAFLAGPETIDATLPPSGAAPEKAEHPSYRSVRLGYQICGFLWLGCALLCLLGAVAAYRRRNFGLAMAASIAALFVFVPLSLIVGGVTIYVLVRAKPEFVLLP